MEIDDLKYLSTCADMGSLSLAAKGLRVETSTVSRRISSLEDQLGLSLFERDHAGIRLTRAGRAVLRHARQILSEYDAMTRLGRKFALGMTGEIRLGLRVPPVGGPARTLIAEWRKTHPEVAITVIEGNERDLALGFSEHRLDAALIAGHTMWPRITATPLYKEKMMAVLPSDHPLSIRPELDWKSLGSETILVQGWIDNHTQQEFYATLLGNDARFHEHAASKQTIMGLVGAGLGITLATDSLAKATFPGIVFKPLAEENAWLEFDLVWLPETEDPLVGRFIAFMRDESRARGFI
jgi:DNA-binding transcriptional LysR family regulator